MLELQNNSNLNTVRLLNIKLLMVTSTKPVLLCGAAQSGNMGGGYTLVCCWKLKPI